MRRDEKASSYHLTSPHLSDEVLTAIIRLQLGRIEKRIAENHKIPFIYDDDVVGLIASRCKEVESGARVVDAKLTNMVLPRISEGFLTMMMEGRAIERVQVSLAEGDFAYGF